LIYRKNDELALALGEQGESVNNVGSILGPKEVMLQHINFLVQTAMTPCI